MLNFAADWSWVTKSIITTLILAGMTIIMMFMQQKYSYGGERFLFAWSAGFCLAFLMFGYSSESFEVSSLFMPFGAFAFVLIIGLTFGGVANIFLGQAIPAAPNPGAVWAIVASNAALSYVGVYFAAKAFPKSFPPIEFSIMNFTGVIVIIIGVVMVMQPSK